jgi:hypothetical protein
MQKSQFVTSAAGDLVMAVCETALAVVSAKAITRRGPEVRAHVSASWRSSGQRVVIRVDRSPTQTDRLDSVRLRSLNPFLLIDWEAGSDRMRSIVEAMQSEARREGFGFH